MEENLNDESHEIRSKSFESTTLQLLTRIEVKLDSMSKRESVSFDRGYLSVKSAAIYCDLSQKTLRRFIAGGRLTAYRPAKGKILLKRRELDAFIDQSTRKVRSGRGIR